MRLQTKLILMIVPVVIIFMMIIGGISHFQVREAVTRKAFYSATTVLNSIDNKISSLLVAVENDIELFSSSSMLESYLLTPDEEERFSLLQPSLIRLFSSYQKANPDYFEIRILLPDGYEDTRVVLRDTPNVTDEEGDSPFFISMNNAEKDWFSIFFNNPDTGKYSLLMSKRIELRDQNLSPISSPKTLRGYLVVTVDIGFIQRDLEQAIAEYGTSYFIANRQGEVLFHSRSAQAEKKVVWPIFAEMFKIPDHIEPFHVTEAGIDSFVFIQNINEDLSLFAQIPKDELFAKSRRQGYLIILITLAAIIAISDLLVVLGRRIIFDPIMSLRNAVLEFGQGKLDIDIPVDRTDEIGQLYRSFKKMATNLKKSQDQIHKLAYHDFLTGLPNRVLFNDFLRRSIAGARRRDERMAILFIDLDDFKRINDTLGHNTGDKLLQMIGERLIQTMRSSDVVSRPSQSREPDMVARLGGDEFTIVLTYIKHQNDAAIVSRRLIKNLSKPFVLQGHEVFVTFSLGISIFPDDGENQDDILKSADVAMYHAKDVGKNNFQYYSPSMNVEALERLSLESELRRAIERNEFVLYYQPQVDSVSQKIIGAEALIRWQHPERGMVPPGEFIPLAEQTGLIVQLGEWVMRTTARQISTYLSNGICAVPVSINLSSPQFQHVSINEMINSILAEENVDPSFLKIELTESIFLKAEEEIMETLIEIKRSGVKICLDDFGTGYSSLNYLKKFPIDVLKIDRSFIMNITKDEKDAEICSAIIALAGCLHMEVVAEGVEEKEQFEFLRERGCETIQGFYFYKPMPAENFAKLLQVMAQREAQIGS